MFTIICKKMPKNYHTAPLRPPFLTSSHYKNVIEYLVLSRHFENGVATFLDFYILVALYAVLKYSHNYVLSCYDQY